MPYLIIRPVPPHDSHDMCFDQTGTERCVCGDIKTSIVLNFILKVGEHSDCHSICRADHLIPPLGQIADNIRLSPFESSYLFSWHCRTKLYDLPLHRSHILSIVWLCFNKLKMNVSCLSKAQRLCAEFVEKLGCIVSQTVEAFVRLHAKSIPRPSGTGFANLCWHGWTHGGWTKGDSLSWRCKLVMTWSITDQDWDTWSSLKTNDRCFLK